MTLTNGHRKLASRNAFKRGAIACAFAIAVLFAGTSAKADEVTHIFQSAVTSSSTEAVPLHVRVEGRILDGNVHYTITNLGDDWPRYSLVGIYYTVSRGVFTNQRIKLKKGESYVLQGRYTGKYLPSLDVKIKPTWMKQQFAASYQHTPDAAWQSVENKTQ